MGLWNIRAKCHACPKSAAILELLACLVKMTLENGFILFIRIIFVLILPLN